MNFKPTTPKVIASIALGSLIGYLFMILFFSPSILANSNFINAIRAESVKYSWLE